MNAIEVLDSMCAEVARQPEDAPLDASEGEETETSAAAAESGEAKKSNKRPSSSSTGSKRPSKKAARLAEEVKQQQEEAAAAAAVQAKAEARQHEIDLARAKRPDAEILVKDCTINLICHDSERESFKSAVIKAASAMKTSE